MGKNFKISVVIPVYNVEAYLQEAVDSIVAQTMGFEENIQLILIDDGSSDASADMCRSYRDAYPENVIFISRPHGGASAARNAGLSFAEGRYVNFMDGDDAWALDAFQIAWDFLEEHREEIDFVSCRQVFFGNKSGYHGLDAKFRKGDRVISIQTNPHYFVLDVHAAFIKREAAEAKQFDERLSSGEDSKYITEVVLEKRRYGVLKSAEYSLRVHGAGSYALQSKNLSRYTDTLDWYYRQLRAWADGEYADCRAYLEQCLLHGLKYRVTQGVLPEGLDKQTYQRDIYGLAASIEDAEFARTPSVGAPRRLYLLRVKHGDSVLESAEIKDGRILAEGYDLGGIPKNTVELRDMRLQYDSCILSGVFRAPFEEGVEFVVRCNGKEIAPETVPDRASSIVSLTGDTVVAGHRFQVTIPFFGTGVSVSFAIRYEDREEPVVPRRRKSLSFDGLAGGWNVEMGEDGVLSLSQEPLFGGLRDMMRKLLGKEAPAEDVSSGKPADYVSEEE